MALLGCHFYCFHIVFYVLFICSCVRPSAGSYGVVRG
nr:MAG TPA: hypothetical protein [Caudoviricetes sp.]